MSKTVTVQQAVWRIVNNLKTVCFCPETEWTQLEESLTATFRQYNKPELSPEELELARAGLKGQVDAFRAKYQRLSIKEAISITLRAMYLSMITAIGVGF